MDDYHERFSAVLFSSLVMAFTSCDHIHSSAPKQPVKQ
jgi:hypothetical protein